MGWDWHFSRPGPPPKCAECGSAGRCPDDCPRRKRIMERWRREDEDREDAEMRERIG